MNKSRENWLRYSILGSIFIISCLALDRSQLDLYDKDLSENNTYFIITFILCPLIILIGYYVRFNKITNYDYRHKKLISRKKKGDNVDKNTLASIIKHYTDIKK